MAASGLEEQIARLEAVATRLENVALGAGKKSSGGADEVELSEASEDWLAFRKNEVEAALKAIEALPNYSKKAASPLADTARAAYDEVTDYIVKADSCKKPTPAELQQALAKTIEAIGYYDGLIYSRKSGMGDWQLHHKAIHAAMDCLTWVSMAPPDGMPKQQCGSGVESCDFNLNKILMKDRSNAPNKAFAQTMKVLGSKMQELVKQHFKQGLNWSGQKSVTEAGGAPKEAAAAAPAPAATEEKAEKPKKAAKKKAATENSGGFEAELSKGLAVTASLKKVKKSQRNKYKKEKISGKVSGGPKKAKAKKKLPDPKKSKRGKTWYLEYYQEGLVTIDADFLPKLDSTYGIYISSCLNCQFLVGEGVKLKSIVVDNCKRVQVQSGDIVSTLEMVNSQNCTMWLNGVTPSISLDKSDSPKVVIMEPCWNQKNMVTILTSNVTAGNVELPTQNEDEDPTVIPINEQYFLNIDKESRTGKMQCMEHAG